MRTRLPLCGLLSAACALCATVTVTTTIQSAVNLANPGDTIQVPPGTYHESVAVSKDRITIQGAPGAVLDGTGSPGNTGITVSPSGHESKINQFNLLGLEIRNYSENGVLLNRVHNFRIAGGLYVNNHEYGIFPVFSSSGTVELNTVTGANDTGIYVGQSSNVTVRYNVARDCTVGFEVENSTHVDVYQNLAVANSTGFLIDLLPGLVETVTFDVSLTANSALNNNRPNPASDPDDILSLLPSGAGILNVGGDKVSVPGNQVLGNNSFGIGVVQLPPPAASQDPRIEPRPDRNDIRNNVVLGNGSATDPKLGALGLSGADLLWDGSGNGNCWQANLYGTAFPSSLPSCR
jgi:parallel beta-helix repeat protein